MTWDMPQAPVEHQAQEPNAHQLVVPAEEQDRQHQLIDLQQGIVHIALPPERFGSAWDAEPRSQEDE